MNPPVPTTRGLLLMALPDVPMSDLGYANGWGDETPLLVEKCREAGHKRSEQTIGRCLREVRCEVCNYKFKVDSGG